ncbi:MAG TPA: methyltransferase [Polyangiaceae bacterium]|jgi:SAM-dependent methyltransferase
MTLAMETAAADTAGARARLLSIGFDEAGVRARLGLKDLNDITGKALPIYRSERLRDRDPLACAIELFVLQGSLSVIEADALLASPDQKSLFRAGILERHGDSIHALASLYPVGRRLIFADHAWPQLGHGAGSIVPHDRVMYVGTDSRWLARTTFRKLVKDALDLCCGSGIHALLAAFHSETATAVDINPRAVQYTAFNARGLGVSNVQALCGDLYAPVTGRLFDLVTANPPFVPAPAQEIGFRDGGPSGEDVLRRIVEGLPAHLAKGGTAQIVTEFGEREGETLMSRVRAWLRDTRMNVHVLRLRVHSAQTYAIAHASGDDPEAILASVGRWSKNLADHGYVRVVSVLLAFQWSDDPWSREDEALPPARDAAHEWEAIFAAESLSRDPALKDRLKAGRVARTTPIALTETRGLGVHLPAVMQARALGPAIAVEHGLDPIERDILSCMEDAIATTELLSAAAKASVPEAAVIEGLVALVRKGLIQLEGR